MTNGFGSKKFSKSTVYAVLASTTLVLACARQNTATSGEDQKLYAPTPANFRLSLTDAPRDDIRSVYVNIDHIEVLMSKGGKKGRMIVGENLGSVDLLKYRNNFKLPVADVDIPDGVSAHQIRLVLKGEDNTIVMQDGSVCQLQTPSARKSGVKIIFGKDITFEEGYSYSMVLDFDADKSIVLQGNGGCLLKPVIKLLSATRLDQNKIDDDDNNSQNDEDMTDGGSWDNGNDGTNSGWDDGSCGLDCDSSGQPADDFTPRDITTYFAQ